LVFSSKAVQQRAPSVCWLTHWYSYPALLQPWH
jgi:hypothetical protein